MTEAKQTTDGTSLVGACLCGAVTIALTDPRQDIAVCHCRMCQRWGGGAFLGVSAASFSVDGRDDVTAYRSSDWAERVFCTICGSNLWYRYVPGDHYSFLAGLFSGGGGDFAMGEQIYIDEKPGHYDFTADTPKLTGAETKAKYGVGG
ncbi:MAG: GFA family protein [Pseudomonadota bacterium]